MLSCFNAMTYTRAYVLSKTTYFKVHTLLLQTFYRTQIHDLGLFSMNYSSSVQFSFWRATTLQKNKHLNQLINVLRITNDFQANVFRQVGAKLCRILAIHEQDWTPSDLHELGSAPRWFGEGTYHSPEILKMGSLISVTAWNSKDLEGKINHGPNADFKDDERHGNVPLFWPEAVWRLQ